MRTEREREIAEAQAAVNQCRKKSNQYQYRTKTGQLELAERSPGDKGYLPPAPGFLTVEWEKGFLTVAMDSFRRMPKTTRSKILDLGVRG